MREAKDLSGKDGNLVLRKYRKPPGHTVPGYTAAVTVFGYTAGCTEPGREAGARLRSGA
jgi:hypothetical protein